MTHYQTLQIQVDAAPEMIEAAWKTLMRRYHPDGAEPDAAKAVRINQAHDVLSNPESRKQYDATLRVKAAHPIRHAGADTKSYPPAYPNPFADFEFDPQAAGNTFLQAGIEATIDYLRKSNPVLDAAMKAAARKKAG